MSVAGELTVEPVRNGWLAQGVLIPFVCVAAIILLGKAAWPAYPWVVELYPQAFVVGLILGGWRYFSGLGRGPSVAKVGLAVGYAGVVPPLWLFGLLLHCALGLECI